MSDKVAHSRGHGTAVKGFVNVDLSGLDSLFEVCGASMCMNSDDACEGCILCRYMYLYTCGGYSDFVVFRSVMNFIIF